jgi:hypothetical protein
MFGFFVAMLAFLSRSFVVKPTSSDAATGRMRRSPSNRRHTAGVPLPWQNRSFFPPPQGQGA